MSDNLIEIVIKHRSKVMTGQKLTDEVNAFINMVRTSGAIVCQNDAGAIVFEPFIASGVVRCWLFFDRFTKSTLSLIKNATDSFSGRCMLAYTSDKRMERLLKKVGFRTIEVQENNDIVLLKTPLGLQSH